MKLLFVTHWANNMLIFRTWMLQEAVRRGHQVLVLCPPDPEAIQFADLGVRHVPWILQRGGGVMNMLRAIRNARQILQKEKPDVTVVYCVQPILTMLWAWKLSRAQGRLFPMFTGLGSLWTDLEPPSWKKRLLRYGVEKMLGGLLPMATMISAQNPDDRNCIHSWNQALSNKTCLSRGEGVSAEFYAPVPPQDVHELKENHGVARTYVISYVGRLTREKGAHDLLRLARLLNSDPYYSFIVAGDRDPGNPSSLCEKDMQELARVTRLIPWQQNVRNIYIMSDILIFPSYREGQGLVALEAMACGTPVLAYNTIGVRETVPRKWLVNTGDMEQMAEWIRRSHDQKEQNAAQARLTASTYHRSMIQKEQLDFYCALSTDNR